MVALGFAPALKLTVVFPVPLVALVIVNHDALLDALHAQLLAVVRPVDPVPPPATTD